MRCVLAVSIGFLCNPPYRTAGASCRRRRSVTIDKCPLMRASLVNTSLRTLTWCCVILLAVLSLLPGQALEALWLLPLPRFVRAVLPGTLEHFVAYAGVAAITMMAYGSSRGGVRIISMLCTYAGIWSTCGTFRQAGIHRSGSLLARRSGRCAAGLSLPCFGDAYPWRLGKVVACGYPIVPPQATPAQGGKRGVLNDTPRSISPMRHWRARSSPGGASWLRLGSLEGSSKCARMSRSRGSGPGCAERREPGRPLERGAAGRRVWGRDRGVP